MPSTRTFNKPANNNSDNAVESPNNQNLSKPVSLKDKLEAIDIYAENNGKDKDEIKYSMAVEAAKNNLKDRDDVDDREFKAEIDSEFNKLIPSKKGSDIRGEDGFTQAVDSLRYFIDDATLAGGNAIDWLFDNTVANLVKGLIDEDAGNELKNMFSGKDLQGAVDVAADIGLSMAGPVGWGALVGKNAIQQSDNIMQGLNGGKDRITNEKIGATESLGHLAEGLGGVALSAVPVVGKVKNAVKAPELLKEMGKNKADDVMKAVEKAGEAQSKAKLPYTSEVGDAIKVNLNKDDIAESIVKNAKEKSGLSRAIRGPKIDDELAQVTTMRRAVDKAAKKAEKEAGKKASKGQHAKVEEKKNPLSSIQEKIPDNIPGALKNNAARMGHGMAYSTVGGGSAALGNFFADNVNGGQETDTSNLLPIVLAGAASGFLGNKHKVNPNGSIGRLIPSAAFAGSSGLKLTDRMYNRKDGDGMSDEEILAALKVR